MSKKVGVDLSNLLSGASYSQEVHELQAQVDSLTQEIEQLRQAGGGEALEEKVNQLRSELAISGILEIPLDQIERNLDQPRQSFATETIETLARSLESDGQQQPIILIELENGRYLLFDGERRTRAALLINWQTIKAVIIPSPQSLHRHVLLTNLHREDLNHLDLAEALVKEIQDECNGEIAAADIPRILNTVVRRLERQGTMPKVSTLVLVPTSSQQQELATLKLSEIEQTLLGVLLSLRLNPASVNANIFPMLALPNDLKQAIREQGLGTMQALALSRLSAKKLGLKEAEAKKVRKRLKQQVLSKKLSISQTRSLVSQEIANYTSTSQDTLSKKQVDGIINRVQSMPVQNVESTQLAQLKDVLQQKLMEIESALAQETELEEEQ